MDKTTMSPKAEGMGCMSKKPSCAFTQVLFIKKDGSWGKHIQESLWETPGEKEAGRNDTWYNIAHASCQAADVQADPEVHDSTWSAASRDNSVP